MNFTRTLPERHRDVLAAALLLAATILAYSPSLQGELLLDDDQHLTRPELRSLEGLGRIWTDIGATQQYYPLLHTAFWIEHRLWGEAVPGYHLVNVFLHGAAALLLVALMRWLRLPGGWLAAFLFALHPVAVESVAWISEQKNTLSTVLCLGAAVLFLRHLETRRILTYLTSTSLFVAALLTKTAVVTLPVVLLVVAWWWRNREVRRPIEGEAVGARTTGPGSASASPERSVPPGFRFVFVKLVPWFAAAVLAGLITLRVERALIAGIEANLSPTWIERVLVAGRAFWFYLAKLFWPANLSFLYERWEVDPRWLMHFLYPVTAAAAGAVLLCPRRRKTGASFAAVACFAVLLAPVLGFVNVEWFVFSYVADHFAYLASMAVILPVTAYAAARAREPARPHARLARVAAVAVPVFFGVLTWRHSANFRNGVTLYTVAVARSPQSIAANYLLGVELARLPGREADAAKAFQAALALNPDAPAVHEQLGRALLRLPDRREDGIGHLEQAVALNPSRSSARNALADAWFDAGKAHAAAGNAAAAISAYERAVALRPEFAEAHFNLGNLFLRSPGRRDEAIASFRKAVAAKPDFAEAQTNLGVALANESGRLSEAIAHFEAALRADPDFAPARNNLARARQALDGMQETKAAP